MRLQRLMLAIGLLAAMAGCQKTEPPEHDTAADTTETQAPVEEARETSTVPDTVTSHMHLHSRQLEALLSALQAGDLEAAGTPAYWLSRHDKVAGLPDDWSPYIIRMRAEAQAIEEATDIEAARAASKRLVRACQGCHEAVGRQVSLPGT